MATKTTGLIIRRNTAFILKGQLTNSAMSMLAPDVAVGAMFFNFDPTTPDSKALLDAADEDPTREGNQHESEPFAMRYWMMERIQMADREPDDDRASVRLVLISPEMETLAFVSSGALKSLDRIRLQYGDGPYDPAIPVTVVEKKIGGGRRIVKLRAGTVAVAKDPDK